jgi:hypothetical protein
VILSILNVKFVGIVIEISCTWKAHIAQLLPKLCYVCFLIKVIKPIMSIETLRIVYYSYFILLWLTDLFSGVIFSFSMQIFRTQKRIIRAMSGLRPRTLGERHFGIGEFCRCSPDIYFPCWYLLWVTWAFIIRHHKYMVLTQGVILIFTARRLTCQFIREHRIILVLNFLIIFL